MPHLRFRGFDESALAARAPALPPELAAIIGCPADWITLECVATRFLAGPAAPMIEVLWFPRENSVRDALARALREAALAWGGPAPAIVFIPLAKADYYEDGKNFAD